MTWMFGHRHTSVSGNGEMTEQGEAASAGPRDDREACAREFSKLRLYCVGHDSQSQRLQISEGVTVLHLKFLLFRHHESTQTRSFKNISIFIVPIRHSIIFLNNNFKRKNRNVFVESVVLHPGSIIYRGNIA